VDEAEGLVSFSHALGTPDFIILGAAIGVLFLIAWLTGRREKSTRDYFLGGRGIPWIVVCLSFVATEVSAVTVVSVPATGFSENMQYLQFFVGSALARIFVAFLFIPAFYKHDCTTIYQYLGERFGRHTQYAGSIFFFFTRLLASGVRLYAACMGISVILGWSLGQSLLLFTGVSIVFIAFGGIKAVVWNGAYETIVFYAAALAVGGYLLWHIDGGLGTVWKLAGPQGADRMSVWNFKLDFADPTTFWAGGLNAFFVGLAVFGTDQELVQRLLTVETRGSSQKALVGTIFAALPITFMYLFIGVLLYVFFQTHVALPRPAEDKEVLSFFTLHYLPVGLKGLVLAAIVLASIDSPLSSLSSSFVTDIYKPLINRHASERHYLWVSRFGVIGFGLILAALALGCAPFQGILWVAFKVLAVTGGGTLGVFLLGLLTKRRGNWANVAAMTASAAAMAVLLYLSEKKIIGLGWSWLIVIGTVATFVLGYLFSLLEERHIDRRGQITESSEAAR
jgi:solute:Na+ symporter, SSS family